MGRAQAFPGEKARAQCHPLVSLQFGKGVLDMARVFDRQVGALRRLPSPSAARALDTATPGHTALSLSPQNMVSLLEERRNRQEPKKSLSLLLAGRTPSVAVELEKESLRL